MNNQQQEDMLHALKSVKDLNESQLLCKQNVTGLGIGFKQTKGKVTDKLCLQVFVDKKRKDKDLDDGDKIPKSLDGMDTDVFETGEITTQALTSKLRPVKPGFSIGHFGITAGTFGAIARDKVWPGRYYILSNNHVLAKSNSAAIGDRILQPGPYDGGVNFSNTVARLAKFVPIQFGSGKYNLVDAALAIPLNMNLVVGAIHKLGIPKGTEEATLGMQVIKTGRTTETTTGTVISIDATVAVGFGGSGVAYFRNQFLTNDMSNGGDSGSLLLNKNSRKATGLLFAGSSSVTVFNNIHNVLMGLNIELLTE